MLFKRGLQERKHESYSGLRIFQVMSVSILSGLLWWRSDTSHIQDQVYIYEDPKLCFKILESNFKEDSFLFATKKAHIGQY